MSKTRPFKSMARPSSIHPSRSQCAPRGSMHTWHRSARGRAVVEEGPVEEEHRMDEGREGHVSIRQEEVEILTSMTT